MKKILSNKNTVRAIGFLIAFSTLASCKKLIEIPANPPTRITRQQVFADSATTMSAVAGVYSCTPGGAGIPYSDGYFALCTSLSSHSVSYTGSYGDYSQFYSYTITPINSEITSLWTAPYSAIYQVNDILDGISNNNKLSASFVKQITGEMEFVRAYYYFNLVNLFGDVPLVTTTDYNTNAQMPKTLTAAVYSQIIKDLNDALTKLPVTYPSQGHARPNFYTALALMAKVHLYQKQWQEAYNEADSVIRLGGFSLLTDLNSVFLDQSAEAIWQVPIQNTYGGSGDAQFFLPYSSSQTPSYAITDALLNQFDSGDLRVTNWMGLNVVNGKNVYFPAKYKDRSPTTPPTDYMLLRFSEMYLIRAEAAAQLNHLSDALADVNVIRARAGLEPTTADPTSQEAVLAAVIKERQTELFCEMGNRWFDLKRTGEAPTQLDGFQSTDALYPLPQSQLKLNSHLSQNPGY